MTAAHMPTTMTMASGPTSPTTRPGEPPECRHHEAAQPTAARHMTEREGNVPQSD